MKRILYTLSLLVFTQSIVAQLAEVHFFVKTNHLFHLEGGFGGNCWELGPEEYTGYAGFSDNVNGVVSWSSCQTCNSNGNCTYGSNIVIGDRINEANRIDPTVDGWEDDNGSRCGYATGFWVDDDDCRTGPGDRGDIYFRQLDFPSNGYVSGGGLENVGGFGDSDFRAWYDIYWFYTGHPIANTISMTCTPQDALQTIGGIRSQSVELTAGVPYRFETTSGDDTYLRLYGTDGYTIVAFNDDIVPGVNYLSQILYTPAISGWYYIETSEYERIPLATTASLQYAIEDIPTEPVANDVTECLGNNVTLTATGTATGTINWYLTNVSTPNIATGSSFNLGSGLTVGTHYRYVSDESTSGCESTRREIEITISPSPSDAPLVADVTICPNSEASLSASNPGSATVLATNFNWYATNALTTILYTGAPYITANLSAPPSTYTYYVVGVLNGCLGSSSSVDVDFYTADVPTTSNDTSICSGDIATITASAIGSTEIRWYQNSDLSGYLQSGGSYTTPTLINTTTYYVTALYANGCESLPSDITVTINPMAQAPILTDEMYCTSEDVILNASNITGTLTWYSDAALTTNIGTGSPLNIGILAAGTYNYFTQIDNGTCVSSVISNTVEVEANPSAPALTPQTICVGETTTLTEVSTNNVNWYSDAALSNLLFVGSSFTTPILSVNTTYWVTNSNANCESASNSVLVTVNPKPTQPTAANDTVCKNEPATLMAVGAGGTYTWYTDAALTNQVFIGGTYITPALSSNTSYFLTEDNGLCPSDATQIYAYVNLDIVVVIDSVTDVLCFDANDGAIYISASGGNGTYTYSWTGGSIMEDLTNAVAGNYVITVSDGLGCSASNNASISTPDELDVSLSLVQNVSCNGMTDGNISVFVSGGTSTYTYSWSDGSSVVSMNKDLINFGAGSYLLTVTDNNGCTDTVSATILENAVLSATIATSNVSCYGGVSSASVTVSGGATPYTYLWSNFDNTNNASNLNSGIISVIVTDANSCSIQVFDTIFSPAEPLTITDTLINHVTCFGGNDGAIGVVVTGGTPPYLYTWTPNGELTPSLSNLTAGIYTLTVRDANACSVDRTFEITSPNEIISTMSVTNPACFGEETGMIIVGNSGGTAPYTYSWNTPSPQSGVIALNLPGDATYTVTITDANGCTSQDNASVDYPLGIVLNTIPTSVSCISTSNGSVTVEVVNGVSPFQYELNGFLQFDSIFDNLDGGNYIVFVKDNNNCIASAAFDINSVSGIEAELEGAGNDLNFVTDNLFIVRGEEASLNVNLINDNGNPIVGYNWSPVNIDTTSLLSSPSFFPNDNVVVVVEVLEDINGSVCSVFDTLYIEVSQESLVFIPTAFTPNNEGANNFFEINVLGASNLDVSIFNRWGELIFNNSKQGNGPSDINDVSLIDGTNPRGAWDGTQNGIQAPTGAYAYKIEVTYFDGTTDIISGSVTIIR